MKMHFKHWQFVSVFLILCLFDLCISSYCFADEKSTDLQTTYTEHIYPLLKQYCWECHSDKTTEADVDLSQFSHLDAMRHDIKTWVKVREMFISQQMPPRDALQPTQAELDQLQSFTHQFLAEEALKHAGEPGPIVLRRLSNSEYTYAIQDLTDVPELNPAAEFPIDGAAGEGFTNVGNGQGMSPALAQKYLEAAKQIAQHVVLLPDGFRFSAATTQQNHTNEALARLQEFYRHFTNDGGGTSVNLQGIQFETNQGGLLPLKDYLSATVAERESISTQSISLADVAQQRGLNHRYLQQLWEVLHLKPADSYILEHLQNRWRTTTPESIDVLVSEIEQAQKRFWKFNPVGHIGREGTAQRWMEPVTQILINQEFRIPLQSESQSDANISLLAIDIKDETNGNITGSSSVHWKQPHLDFKNHPPLMIRDLARVSQLTQEMVFREGQRTQAYLKALLKINQGDQTLQAVAQAEKLNPVLLQNWATFTGVGIKSNYELTGHFKERIVDVQGYKEINGWGNASTPSLLTNQSDQPITLSTLTLPPKSVVVHPSPDKDAIVAWRSPTHGIFKLSGLVADADHNCGNGAQWRVVLQSGRRVSTLREGVINNGANEKWDTGTEVTVQSGDVISLIVAARDKDHVCDSTHVKLTLTEIGGEQRVWDLDQQVVEKILDSNPQPDSYGNPATWHFCESVNHSSQMSKLPAESSLAKWSELALSQVDDKSTQTQKLEELAGLVERVLNSDTTATLSEADHTLTELLQDWLGPLGWLSVSQLQDTTHATAPYNDKSLGIDPVLFDNSFRKTDIPADDLVQQAPLTLTIRIPAALARHAEFVTTGVLQENTGVVQLQVVSGPTPPLALDLSVPVLILAENSSIRDQIEAAQMQFRNLFPPALCYARIVPVDEVVTLTLYHREDDHLSRLMLDESQQATLNTLWAELYFISEEPLKLVVAHEQLVQFATQDRQELVPAFSALKQSIQQRADEFNEHKKEVRPTHLIALLKFAEQAWRRPLTQTEVQNVELLYQQLLEEGIAHPDSIQLLIARVLTSPSFMYKLEEPHQSAAQSPITDTELASRLSFFLWSSLPDKELMDVAKSGKLQNEEMLQTQMQRMLQDAKVRRFAIEFACQWLHVRNFDQNDDKNEALYPEFSSVRGEMYEETILFFEDMFRNNGSILDLVNAEHTFLNESLAAHYAITGIKGDHWRKVEQVQTHGRGGVLGMGTVLASQSGASRTSPILRGNWVYETLLGQRLPRPPANIPQLPEQLPEGLSARELIEQHSSRNECKGCHSRIDPYGFALEQFDAIGRPHPTNVSTEAQLPDGQIIDGVKGLREYLVQHRREDVIKQFCRKLLGFALGRELQLSDEPFIQKMQSELAAHDDRFHTALQMIILSPQFREIRGHSATY